MINNHTQFGYNKSVKQKNKQTDFMTLNGDKTEQPLQKDSFTAINYA